MSLLTAVLLVTGLVFLWLVVAITSGLALGYYLIRRMDNRSEQMRLRARVDANQAEIVEALRKVGCCVRSTAQIGKGFPDLIVVSPTLGTMLIEVKMPGEKLTVAETNWHREWKAPVRIVYSVEDALKAVGVEVSE